MVQENVMSNFLFIVCVCVELVVATAANGDENRVNCGDAAIMVSVCGARHDEWVKNSLLEKHAFRPALASSLFHPQNKSPLAFLSATGCWFFPLSLSLSGVFARALLSFSGVI